jgi:hypothetical protein
MSRDERPIQRHYKSTFEWLYGGGTNNRADANANFTGFIIDYTDENVNNDAMDSCLSHASDNAIGSVTDGARDNPDKESNITTTYDALRQHCDTFSEWLSPNKSLFWINGKPGSGKSTLMKFLLEHLRTQELLREQDPSTLNYISFHLECRLTFSTWSEKSSFLFATSVTFPLY